MIRHRRGLTLIELVLAVAGTSVLLGLIVSVMTSQARLIARSQQSIEITRASLRLSQWLREDLSTLQRRETDGVLDPTESSVNERVLLQDYSLADSPLQLCGTDTMLAIGRFVPNDDSGARTGGLRFLSTVWSAPSVSTAAVPYLAADLQIRYQTIRDGQRMSGQDRGVSRASFYVNDKFAQPLTTCSFAPIAAAIRFRYFDGTRWQDRWNSQQQQSLPQVIECLIDFAGEPEPRRIHIPLLGNVATVEGASQ